MQCYLLKNIVVFSNPWVWYVAAPSAKPTSSIVGGHEMDYLTIINYEVTSSSPLTIYKLLATDSCPNASRRVETRFYCSVLFPQCHPVRLSILKIYLSPS